MDNRWSKLNRRGFTMAETLVAVGIIGILSAAIFVGVANYLRTMRQLERDGIAKELFVSAQNHLTTADSQGYLGKADYGHRESLDKEDEVFYFVVNGGESFTGDSVLDEMLPFGSVDETVRLGGSYIVRYQRDPARVLDVFYSSKTGTRYGLTLSQADYGGVMAVRGAGNRQARRKYGSTGAVLGWYGGEDADNIPKGKRLETPLVELVNAERLLCRITDPNDLNPDAQLKLIVTGETSRAVKEIAPSSRATERNIEYDNVRNTYIVTLDDITTKQGLHFTELFGGDGFIPGEDISVQAVSYSSTVYTNVAYSSVKRANSLFAGIAGNEGGAGSADQTVAYVGNFRHLENLDRSLSGVNGGSASVRIASAVQTSDLDWDEFTAKAGGSSVSVYKAGGGPGTKGGCYQPVTPSYTLDYDGRNHSVTGVRTDEAGDAGLFGLLQENSKVRNLMLVDFEITSGGGSAGSLAGRLSDSEVLNVLSRGETAFVKGGQISGGLVGSAEGGSITASAAALYIEGSAAAGGLVGSASGTSVEGCYSAGHTKEGKYSNEAEDYNVRSQDGTAGGLIGEASGVTVSASYSTCSVSGGTAGGFTGSADGSFSDCYAVGLVEQREDSTAGAFAGSFTGSAEGCRYLESINWKNEREGEDGGAENPGSSGAGAGQSGSGNSRPRTKQKVKYLQAVGTEENEEEGDSIAPADADTASFSEFFRGPEEWAAAFPYDTTLIRLYRGRYCLKSVTQLEGGPDPGQNYFVSVHYGDWPSPEIMLVNE